MEKSKIKVGDRVHIYPAAGGAGADETLVVKALDKGKAHVWDADGNNGWVEIGTLYPFNEGWAR